MKENNIKTQRTNFKIIKASTLGFLLGNGVGLILGTLIGELGISLILGGTIGLMLGSVYGSNS